MTGAYVFDVGGADNISTWRAGIWSMYSNDGFSTYPQFRSAAGTSSGMTYLVRSGSNTLLKYAFLGGTSQPITLETTSGTIWGDTFVDNTSLVFSEEPTSTPLLAELYKIGRDGTNRTALTNLHQYMGPPSAAQNGKIYVAWAVDRNHNTQLAELSAAGSILRTLTTPDLYRWRPAISQNGRWLAFEQYDPTFAIDRLFVMDLNAPTNPPVAVSPSTGI